jgi:hypothetical protein
MARDKERDIQLKHLGWTIIHSGWVKNLLKNG